MPRHGGRIAKTAGDRLLLAFPGAMDAVRRMVVVAKEMAMRGRDVAPEIEVCFRFAVNIASRIDYFLAAGGGGIAGMIFVDSGRA